MKGILSGIAAIHSHQIIHRDLTPRNVLYDGEKLKVTDFGLSRQAEAITQGYYTPGVCTCCYRSPEVLLKQHYSYPMDVWSIGCIFYELFTNKICFPGDSEANQVMRIFRTLGTPTFGQIGF